MPTLTMDQVNEMQAYQLRRLLNEVPAFNFEMAYYVIFSDYPTIHSLACLLVTATKTMPEDKEFLGRITNVANNYIKQ